MSYELVYQKTNQVLEYRLLNESTLQYSWYKNIKHCAKYIQIWLICKDLTSFFIITEMFKDYNIPYRLKKNRKKCKRCSPSFPQGDWKEICLAASSLQSFLVFGGSYSSPWPLNEVWSFLSTLISLVIPSSTLNTIYMMITPNLVFVVKASPLVPVFWYHHLPSISNVIHPKLIKIWTLDLPSKPALTIFSISISNFTLSLIQTQNFAVTLVKREGQ